MATGSLASISKQFHRFWKLLQ